MASSTDSTNNDSTSPGGLGIIYRPPFQLRSLPIWCRWDATRRHPYYQDWWKTAQAHYRGAPVDDPVVLYLGQAAVMLLGAIGVSGIFPDPATDFERLEAEQLSPGWLSGAVHPITLRGMAGLLIALLPKETAGHVGLLLVQAGCDDKADGPPPRIPAMLDLSKLEMPGLNDFPDEPIVSINPAASGPQIKDAIESLLPRWKSDRDLCEQRDRSDKYAKYLQVWDQREGWTGASYDRLQEHTFREIASDLKLSISTVSNHYRSAFEIVVGHPYSPDLWYRTVGPLKLGQFAMQLPARLSRPLSSPVRRPISEAELRTDPDTQSGPVTAVAGPENQQSYAELLWDIDAQIRAGRTDEEIVRRLDLPPDFIPAIAYVRERNLEGL